MEHFWYLFLWVAYPLAACTGVASGVWIFRFITGIKFVRQENDYQIAWDVELGDLKDETHRKR